MPNVQQHLCQLPMHNTYFARTRALSRACMLLLLLGALNANAQSRHEGWYQVELLAFSRPQAQVEEQFPHNINLRYPQQWVELKELAATDGQTHTADANTVNQANEPFTLLPANERSLNDEARRLVRAGGYQLLFHQAWRQPIYNSKNAQSIIISGGQSYGKHQELEGSITISVATYLTLTTNLWLTQFGVNIDQNNTTWPSLPLRPNYRAPVSHEPSPLNSPANPLDNPLADWSNLQEIAEEDEPTPYAPQQIVLLKEKRDMRSSEVHYIDHPLLGLIIKITPYTIEPQQ